MEISDMSDFAKWFEGQFGKRERLPGSDDEHDTQVRVGKQSALEIKRRELWDERREAALKAWATKGSKDD